MGCTTYKPVPSQNQVFEHARNSAGAEIRTVDERHAIHGADHGDKAAVDAAPDATLLLRGELDFNTIVIWPERMVLLMDV
jgi:hypothetical protein